MPSNGKRNGHANGNGGAIRVYRSYNFIDKDPAIDSIRTIVDSLHAPLKQVGEESGVHASTLRAWFTGNTKQPRHSNMSRVLGAYGYEFVIQKRREHDDKARAPLIINRLPTTAQVRARPRPRKFKDDRVPRE